MMSLDNSNDVVVPNKKAQLLTDRKRLENGKSDREEGSSSQKTHEAVSSRQLDPCPIVKATPTTSISTVQTVEDDCSDGNNVRERLNGHRVEVAGRVWIPERWGQDGLLKDWIDCTSFDSSLASNSAVMSARASLIEQGRRANATRLLKIEHRC